MSDQVKVFAYLDALSIPYASYTHPAVRSMDDCRALDLGGGIHCKNLLLCNRAKTKYTLLLLDADRPFVTGEMSRRMGSSRLSFAGDDALREILHTEPGAVSPMGLIFDSTNKVSLFCDPALLNLPLIAFHPLTTQASIVLSRQDFFGRFLASLCREAQMLNLD